MEKKIAGLKPEAVKIIKGDSVIAFLIRQILQISWISKDSVAVNSL